MIGPVAALMARADDALRERRIQAHKADVLRLLAEGRKPEAHVALQDMTAEIDQRSPAQVERMERARGLRV